MSFPIRSAAPLSFEQGRHRENQEILVDLLGLFDCFFDRANHVERLFRQMIELAAGDHLEALDRIFQRNVFTWRTGKHFSNVERLRQEALHLTRTRNQQLVFRSQFVHTQNRDNVAQFFVALQDTLHSASCFVVFLTNDLRVQLTRCRIEWIDRRVDTQRSDVTRQNDGRIQVSKRGSWRWVGQVIRWNVDGLDRGDRTSLGRSNTLLQLAHFRSQRRLVTHGGRHTAQQRGNFSTGQRVTVDIVDEEQYVFTFVTEAFSDGQAGQRNAQTVARGFVHLTIDHGDLGVLRS